MTHLFAPAVSAVYQNRIVVNNIDQLQNINGDIKGMLKVTCEPAQLARGLHYTMLERLAVEKHSNLLVLSWQGNNVLRIRWQNFFCSAAIFENANMDGLEAEAAKSVIEWVHFDFFC